MSISTIPDNFKQACKRPHGVLCLTHKDVHSGTIKPCDVCAPLYVSLLRDGAPTPDRTPVSSPISAESEVQTLRRLLQEKDQLLKVKQDEIFDLLERQNDIALMAHIWTENCHMVDSVVIPALSSIASRCQDSDAMSLEDAAAIAFETLCRVTFYLNDESAFGEIAPGFQIADGELVTSCDCVPADIQTVTVFLGDKPSVLSGGDK